MPKEKTKAKKVTKVDQKNLPKHPSNTLDAAANNPPLPVFANPFDDDNRKDEQKQQDTKKFLDAIQFAKQEKQLNDQDTKALKEVDALLAEMDKILGDHNLAETIGSENANDIKEVYAKAKEDFNKPTKSSGSVKERLAKLEKAIESIGQAAQDQASKTKDTKEKSFGQKIAQVCQKACKVIGCAFTPGQKGLDEAKREFNASVHEFTKAHKQEIAQENTINAAKRVGLGLVANTANNTKKALTDVNKTNETKKESLKDSWRR